ncbi:uncharacterized protein CMU_014980 [Cryptosporidium muris RN66]|uniref:Uncharacterized protein n=1 Tax=Cryptosporidium muris (strain RN66) TaxID=441375 RepID=B6AF55_CRYMR|nr:uncharacterized protein CMU_014980 [Cryptosporidium muris RN66]EEA06821.1 hypothetical protein CMU_014980 [Cryptosporidium muris RN66]|eukprot:XP_002141170.1 hypothetical protein [Cryptosporidium muris RN66]
MITNIGSAVWAVYAIIDLPQWSAIMLNNIKNEVKVAYENGKILFGKRCYKNIVKNCYGRNSLYLCDSPWVLI